jgi:hypothetical protein
MVNYSFWISLIKQKLASDDAISAAVQGHVYTSAPGMLPVDEELNGKPEDPNLQQACIAIQHSALVSSGLCGVAYHGLSMNDQQIFFIITVQNISGRDSDTYAAYIAGLIHDFIKGGITQDMNGQTYQINFKAHFRITSIQDPAFPNRANVKIEAEIGYLG